VDGPYRPSRRLFCRIGSSPHVACRPLAADEKEGTIHELDAVVFYLYGLGEPHLVHIFEAFHEGRDYNNRLRGVRMHYRAWR
jgi:hypothetical protein